jgi:hypothetical protein
MKRLVKKLAFAAVGCLMVAAVAGCDLLGTAQKTGLSPQLMKHRFTFIGDRGRRPNPPVGWTGDERGGASHGSRCRLWLSRFEVCHGGWRHAAGG